MKTLPFHRLLRQCIRKYGKSQRAFAKHVGIGQSTINDWLYQESPSVQTRSLKRLAAHTDVTYEEWVLSFNPDGLAKAESGKISSHDVQLLQAFHGADQHTREMVLRQLRLEHLIASQKKPKRKKKAL